MSQPPPSTSSTPIVNSFDQIIRGEFKRTATDFHSTIEPNGIYPPEENRYVLYVSYACPWAHRCLITLALKGLTHVIKVTAVHPVWGVVDQDSGRQSWVFSHPDNKDCDTNITLANLLEIPENPDDISTELKTYINNVNIHTTTHVGNIDVRDTNYNKQNLRQIYELNDPKYVGRYTVPVLWDSKTQSIVNNESSEIIRILDTAFNQWAKNPSFSIRPDGVDEALIEAANTRMYNAFNNGVYRAGFAQSQEAYLKAVHDVFDYLNETEGLLSTQRFLAGNTFSEADIRFLVTLLRFDIVYVVHFKTAWKRIRDYPNIFAYICDIWQNIFNDDARATYNEDHIKYHYYVSHEKLNKFALVPWTLDVDYNTPTDRSTKFSQ